MSTPYVVARVCRAEQLIDEAVSELMRARDEVRTLSKDAEGAGEAMSLLRDLAETTLEHRGRLGEAVKKTAALIPAPS